MHQVRNKLPDGIAKIFQDNKYKHEQIYTKQFSTNSTPFDFSLN